MATIYNGVLRIAGESDAEWENFIEYMKLPVCNRSVKSLSEKIGKHYTVLLYQYKKNKWHERSVGEDDDPKTIINSLNAVRSDHANILRKMRELGNINLDRLVAEARIGDGQGASMSPKDVVILLEKTISLELELGSSPAEIVSDKAGLDYSKLTEDELFTLRNLLLKARNDD